MQAVFSYFARHGTAANLLMVLMIAAGLIALPRMRAQYFPDVVVEDIEVSVSWPGAGAEDVDRAIVQLLEPALLVIEGVATSNARATEGRASIDLEFEPGWDMARAMADVESAVGQSANLPADAEAPNVRRGAWRDRVADAVITGPVSVDQLGRFADEFVARLYAQGVTRTAIQGLAAPETVVEVPSAMLVRHDISMAEVAAAIASEAAANPAGEVSGGAARVRTGVERRAPDALAAIVLRTNPDGSNLTIGDLADIRVEGADRARALYVGDNPAMIVRVDRTDTGDAIELHQKVAAVAVEMAPLLPPGSSIELIRARAESISARLSLLIGNGITGLILVVIMLFLFLNARIAFWVAAGIPMAGLATIAVMYGAGLTLNMVSIFALIITIGIVVDDAIVVGEHADFRARRLGEGPLEAADNATRRMAGPVFASSLTTIAAFLGLVAISGSFGRLVSDIPFTVAIVLMASLVENFLILPHHLARALAHSRQVHWYDWPNRFVNHWFRKFRETLFRPFIGFVVRARYPMLAGVVALLAWQVSALISGQVQWRFFDAPEQGSVTGNFAMLPGANHEDTLEMMRALQQVTAEVGAEYEAKYGTNPVHHAMAEVGGNAGRSLASAGTRDPELLGAISIELIDPDLRPYSSFEFVASLQERVPSHPLLEEVSFRGWRSGPGGDALDIQLSGLDAPGLKRSAEALKSALATYPEVSALEDSLAYDKDEMILELTSQGQALGFTIDELGRVLRNRLNGIEAAQFPDGPRSATVTVSLPEGETGADFLERTMLRTSAGGYVPLSDIVTVTMRSGFAAIERVDGLRQVAINGDLSGDDPDRAAAILVELEHDILPRLAEEHGVAWTLGGLAEDEANFLNDALLGFAGALGAIYLILAWIFASWTRPLVVMSVIPFGLIGAIWGHGHWDLPLSMFSVVGLIGMSGIIINDSIVLVSTIDEYSSRRGMVPAIVDAVTDRLRPVFLTTATTVIGMAPLLYERSSQALFLKPTIITLVYGLGFGMVLVLVIIPALAAAQHDFGRFARALRRSYGVPRLRVAMVLASLGVAGALGVSFAPALQSGAALWPAFGRFVALALAAALLAMLVGYALSRRVRRGSRAVPPRGPQPAE